MRTLYPIWGNGWWLGEQRVEPPPQFQVQVESETSSGAFQGRIHSSDDLDGQMIQGGPSFVGTTDWITVQIAPDHADLVEPDSPRKLTGYAKVQTS